MVKLYINCVEITLLEWMLHVSNIPYEVEFIPPDSELDYPYLVVDGVQLDFDKSVSWIKEYNNGR